MNIQSLYSQRDLKWASLKIGDTNLTLGRYGCTITCLSMLTGIAPNQMLRALKFSGALVVWQSCVFPRIKFEFREYGYNSAKVQHYIADPHKAVILEVNNGSHWVVPVAYFPDGSYICADPWTGTYENLLLKYHNITGAAYFNG